MCRTSTVQMRKICFPHCFKDGRAFRHDKQILYRTGLEDQSGVEFLVRSHLFADGDCGF